MRVEWAETAEELAALLAREDNPHRRTRLEALLRLRQGHRIGEVSAALGMNYRSVQRWEVWYRAGGLMSVLARTPGHASLGNPHKLDPEQRRDIARRYAAGQFPRLGDAAAWVEAKHGVRYSPSGMAALLRRECGRVPQRRRAQRR